MPVKFQNSKAIANIYKWAESFFYILAEVPGVVRGIFLKSLKKEKKLFLKKRKFESVLAMLPPGTQGFLQKINT